MRKLFNNYFLKGTVRQNLIDYWVDSLKQELKEHSNTNK